MFKSAATKIAHNSTIPSLGLSKDLRPLQDLITAEKVVLISLQKLSVDFAKAAEALRAWGVGEGDDLGDTLSASTTLLTHFSTALSQYAAHGHPMRDYLKSIRTREENLDELKRRRKSVGSKAENAEKKLSKMSPEHKNLPMQTDALNMLRAEIRSLDSEIMSEEAALGDFKRTTTRAWMGLKFGGMVECSQKGIIAGESGKMVIAEIPEVTTEPGMSRSLYYGHPKTESLISEAYQRINEVVLSAAPSSGSSNPQRFNQPQQFNAPQQTPQPHYQDGGMDPWMGTGGASPSVTERWPSQTSGTNLQGGGPPDYLSTHPQGFSMGGFSDRSSQPSTNLSPPTSPIQQQDLSQQRMLNYSQADTHESIPGRSIDDFAVNNNPSSLTEQSGGGRFATFPVKTRAPGASGGFSLRDDPPSLSPRHEVHDSFSSSVAEALGSSQKQHSINGARDRPLPHTSIDTPTQVTIYPPPPGPPPGFQPGPSNNGNMDMQGQGNPRNSTFEDDPLLAYMTSPDDQHDDSDDQDPRPGDYGRRRHVRFGGVSDVDEEIRRLPTGHLQQLQQSQNSIESGGIGTTQSLPQAQLNTRELSPTTNETFQNQQQIPHPAMNSEEERALNAAAAREIGRELDLLKLNPPPPIAKDDTSLRDTSPDRGQPSYQSTLEYNGSLPSIHSDMSPLAPPSAPFTRRTPSPRPSMDSSSLPSMNSSPRPSSAPYAPPPTYSQEAPTQERRRSSLSRDGEGSPTNATIPKPNTPILPAPSLQENQSGFSSMSQSPYQTPPEYPRGLGISSSLITKSTSSLNTQVPPGTRTISAAAFKRPPPRKASGDIPGISDTSPLSVKKRLPSSPYPKREASPMSRDLSSSVPSSEAPLPPPSMLPPIQVDDTDDYDYLSAYVTTGSPPRDVAAGPLKTSNDPGNNHHGYGAGKFTTDLEEGGLR